MSVPQITRVDSRNHNEVIVELSDGRTLTFSLAKILTLTPDIEVTDQDADEFEA